MELKGLLLRLKESAAGPCPRLLTLFPQNLFQYYPPIYALVFRVASSHSGFSTKVY
jgi:hypothetical protein